MKISIIETKTVPTIKIEHNKNSITFHSRYDPLREANTWCKNALTSLKGSENIIVIGIGAGYHIKALAGLIPNEEITVIEFNKSYYTWFKDSPFSDNISQLENVTIEHIKNLTSSERKDLFSSVHSSNLLIHKSGLDIIPSEYEEIKKMLEDMQFKKNSIRNQIDIMDSNFSKNVGLKDEGIGTLRNKYNGKPMILISAGPSLDKQIPLLKKAHDEDKVILGAVGTAIKPLIKNHIIPDFFSIIDPNPGTYEQLTGIELPETTLYYLSTTFHETLLLHKGPRRILWQHGYEEAEKLASICCDPLIHTGGSVATALLDLMIYLGAGSLALVGQDLAYTDGLSHATHAHARKSFSANTAKRYTVNFDQSGKVITSRNLSIYRKWFEDYAQEQKSLELYNCTEGGAYINNWVHISLDEFYNAVIN